MRFPCSHMVVSVDMLFFYEGIIGIWRSFRSDQLFSFELVLLSATLPTDKSLTVSQNGVYAACRPNNCYKPDAAILAGLHLRAPFLMWTKLISKMWIKIFLGGRYLGNARWHIQIHSCFETFRWKSHEESKTNWRWNSDLCLCLRCW